MNEQHIRVRIPEEGNVDVRITKRGRTTHYHRKVVLNSQLSYQLDGMDLGAAANLLHLEAEKAQDYHDVRIQEQPIPWEDDSTLMVVAWQLLHASDPAVKAVKEELAKIEARVRHNSQQAMDRLLNDPVSRAYLEQQLKKS